MILDKDQGIQTQEETPKQGQEDALLRGNSPVDAVDLWSNLMIATAPTAGGPMIIKCSHGWDLQPTPHDYPK